MYFEASLLYLYTKKCTNCTGCPTRYPTRLASGPLLRVATIRRTTDTFLFISHTTNVLLFKFRCNILIGVRIIKEMPGSVPSGTPCTTSFSHSPKKILPLAAHVLFMDTARLKDRTGNSLAKQDPSYTFS